MAFIKSTLAAGGLACVAMTAVPDMSEAALVFTFSEVSGDVVMESSGSIDLTGLVDLGTAHTWGNVGIQYYDYSAAPAASIMGGTSVGQVDASYGFNAGTDFSAWDWADGVGPWDVDYFPWTVTSGEKGFATYMFDGNDLYPGLGVESADVVNGIWTPDQNWLVTGQTFASLNMYEGTYTVTDALSGESISFVIGDGSPVVPLPAGLPLVLTALAGFGVVGLRRRGA
ncbi:hypothetical protein RGUI_1942 [Rhodovulum sp. P5]|uniref:VPLPA-CTERM sorting domain-containing protein n=1 Tax=Rhodovulum sp. P5 TaxID=1564506 RepID=UPI0009C37F8A|nr:VPLPA-CTERM sorting domain-containing protein [Rhodovulum sp. P5]ARE40083.1 hypothetical protein RGUI_1942 [Rhodovulum sp. P5]